ncbi:MAG: bifunctional 4-hydroxy-3-methylbut-2-enyl diphosphate reductase/30S ribosomal protein S1 [Clostridia bacterium]|nr:bifunctional 4-hydroxy-3-methylbut-2-enyl diphosphate reductase/30S ribosomal protein S1 [Clostridia bacterium]
MKVDLAQTAGFCFGVSEAMRKVTALLDEGKTVYTLGPLIHNPQTVAALAARGVRIVDDPGQVPPDVTLVIRSHGVGEAVLERARAQGLEVCDATCPFVKKIHHIVAEQSDAGAVVLIAGDAEHSEVIGIQGHCHGESHVFASEEELRALCETHGDWGGKPVVLVSQTTFNQKIWTTCEEFAKKHYTNAFIFDTICNATAKRQQEAVELSQSHDMMVIVGGRQSSNTAKLRDVCAPYAPTYLVESADEIERDWFRGVASVGLTAGASTPADIIKEVQSTMSDIVNEVNEITNQPNEEAAAVEETAQAPEVAQTEEVAAPVEETAPAEPEAPQKSFDEMSFEEALEASLNSLNTDERVHGIVTEIYPNEVQVEVIGRKQTGYIPADELTAQPGVNPADVVKVGDELELLIMRTNDQEGTIMLSKKRVDSLKGWDTIVAAADSGEILEGTVTDVIKGGVLAVSHGVRLFIPASHASAVRMDDLSPLVGQPIRFRVIEVNTSRRRAVGSVRSVYREERKEREKAFWENAEVGQKYTGVVKSMTSYGAFVDLGGVDGMIHVSELSWSRVKNPADVLSIGQTVEVYIKGLDQEKHKISLGYRKDEDNPWEIFKKDYKVGDVITAKVVGMTTFGAFAQIIPGVDGLIHISQIANHRVEKPQDELSIGQEVEVKITNVDYDKKRISLSIRVLLPEEAPAEAAAEEPAEEVAEAAAEAVAEEAPAAEETPAETEETATEAAAEETAEEAPAEEA